MRGSRERARSVNNWLDTMVGRSHECRQQLYATGKAFTATHVRRLMQGEELFPVRKLSDIFTYQIDFINSLVGQGYTLSTLRKYKRTYEILKRYMKHKYEADDLRLDGLDFKFIREYEAYLRTNYSMQNNTVASTVRRVKTVIKLAMNLGWLSHDPFIAMKLKVEEVYRDYLTSEELSRMAAKKFKLRRLATVRDLFVFSCYTGLSYADTVKLELDDIFTAEDGAQWLQSHRTKNNNRVRIPLLTPALRLIKFYHDDPRRPDGRLFPPISNQKANAYLKEIAKAVHIKKKLTYHVARHTFATTVTLTNGVPIETVGQMLGHKSIKSTQLYARVTDTKVKLDMEPLKARYEDQELDLEKEY
jgi:site-specific recombinase XerD